MNEELLERLEEKLDEYLGHKFTFETNDGEEALRMMKSSDLAGVIWTFIYNTKKSIEWWIDAEDEVHAYDVLDKVFDRFYEILDEYNINIDELYS